MVITELQQKMLDLLFELDEYLRENDIKYMLFAGSQLGVDRKQGMIPWDDDIDIFMTLENYEKFMEAVSKSLPENRKVNSLEISDDYLFTYARYIDTTTTALQRHTVFGGVDPGVKIDVFFTVPTDKDEVKARHHQMEILAFNELVFGHGIMFHKRPEDFFPVYEAEKKVFEKLGRKEYIHKRLPELKYRYYVKGQKPERYVLFSGMMSNSYLFETDKMENVKDVDFEGHPAMVAEDGHYFDLMLYGESWYKTPGDISMPYHNWTLDLHRPYADTLKGIGEYIDLKKAKETMRTRKLLRLEEQMRFKDALIMKEEIKNLSVAMSVENRLRDYEKNRKIETPEELFSIIRPYASRQVSRENRWYGLAMPAKAELVQTVLETLAIYGEFAMVKGICDILSKKENAKRARGINTDKVLKEAELSKKLIYAAYADEFSSSKEMAEKVNDIINEGEEAGLGRIKVGAFPWVAAGNEAIQEALGRVMLSQMREAETDEEKQALARKLIAHSQATCSEYGEMGELVILGAYGLEELERQGIDSGLEMTADRLFEKAGENVSNAFVVQEILNHGVDLMNKEHKKDSLKKEIFVTSEEFEKIRKEMSAEYPKPKNGCEFVVKGKGEKEYLVLYDRNRLASTTLNLIKNNKDNTCSRTIWRKCGEEGPHTKYMDVALSEDNVSPEELIKRADKEGIMGFFKNRKYLAYSEWEKENWTEPKKAMEEYEAKLKAFVEKDKA